MIFLTILLSVCVIGFLSFFLWKSQKALHQSTLERQVGEEKIKNLENQKKEEADKLKIFEKHIMMQFENISQKIFDEKTLRFKKDSKEQLENTLQPLREQIKNFQEKAEKHYGENTKEVFSLKNEIKNLFNVSQQMNQETQNLTQALKGDSKVQGTWGELILNQVLEASGLRESEEYFLQGRGLQLKSESGSPLKPDVVIKLPQKRHLVIDAKVSLKHYEKFISSQNSEDQTECLKNFTNSIRKHISDLSLKKYQYASGLNSLDFVFLFFPQESAFSTALQFDRTIIELAWKESVVVVSPTTLLATLRTVAFMWQREKENKNVMEIARKAGALYDKFVGFTDDLKQIGLHLERSTQSHEEAYKKLSTGRGNIVSRLEEIKKLGARADKQINSKDLQP